MTASDGKAVALYAVLARDWSDFLDMCKEADAPTLETLHLMLTTPNERHDRATVELNRLGADLVAPMIAARHSA